MSKYSDTISKLAGAPTNEKQAGDVFHNAGPSRSLIADLIAGFRRNPKIAGIDLGGALHGLGLTDFDIAKTAGVITALDEAGFTVKEACESLGVSEDVLQAVAAVTK